MFKSFEHFKIPCLLFKLISTYINRTTYRMMFKFQTASKENKFQAFVIHTVPDSHYPLQ
jgi:hypothetical protein